MKETRPKKHTERVPFDKILGNAKKSDQYFPEDGESRTWWGRGSQK